MKMSNTKKTKSNNKSFSELYVDISSFIKAVSDKTWNVIENVYGSSNPTLPIDIHKIADYYKIKVQERDLSDIPQLPTNKVFGILRKSFNGIYSISIEKNIDFFNKRYALAHEIGHHMIISDNEPNDSDTIKGIYSMPLLSGKTDEYLADIYAIFLLMPLNIFLHEFSEFVFESVENNDESYPINIEEWFKSLSVRAQIPNHNLELSYEYIRMAAYKHYIELQGKPIASQFKEYAYLFV